MHNFSFNSPIVLGAQHNPVTYYTQVYFVIQFSKIKPNFNKGRTFEFDF